MSTFRILKDFVLPCKITRILVYWMILHKDLYCRNTFPFSTPPFASPTRKMTRVRFCICHTQIRFSIYRNRYFELWPSTCTCTMCKRPYVSKCFLRFKIKFRLVSQGQTEEHRNQGMITLHYLDQNNLTWNWDKGYMKFTKRFAIKYLRSFLTFLDTWALCNL